VLEVEEGRVDGRGDEAGGDEGDGAGVEAELVVLVEELADDEEEVEEEFEGALVAVLEEEDEVVLGAGGRSVGTIPTLAAAGIAPPIIVQVRAHMVHPTAASDDVSARRGHPRSLISLSSPELRFIACRALVVVAPAAHNSRGPGRDT
jgi:hypothetical protein